MYQSTVLKGMKARLKLSTLVRISLTLGLLILALPSQAFEQYWQCSSRQGGDWSFGRAPSICLVDHMQTQDFVKSQYDPILFKDSLSRTNERKRYITELNALAKEVARYYLQKRKPGVSEAEIAAFTKGLLTLMHQETVWSHYRRSTDGRVRYMRGDFGHGHGLMQVDDRSHQTALLQGKGADLIHNMMYGLDVFYGEWQRAPSQYCVNGPTDYKNRIRSAWAAYNGGPGRICRWTSTTGTYAHHDKDFLSKLNNQVFKNYVTTENKETALNVQCLSEGSRPCANTGTSTKPVQPKEGQLYQVGSGFYCLVKGDELQCVDRLNDVNCLNLRDSTNYASQGSLSEEQLKNFSIRHYDRNSICQASVDGLISISSEIELQKSINLRRTPAGELATTVPQGSKLKILDFEVTSTAEQFRYYKLNYEGVEGYVYAGDLSSHPEWAVEVEDMTSGSLLANIGESLEVKAPYGINQRATPNGRYLQRIPVGTQVQVLDRIVRGNANYLYYKVSYNNLTGYIYSGYLTNLESVSYWTSKLDNKKSLLSLSQNQAYQYLKECPESSCSYSEAYLESDKENDQVEVVEEKSGWSLVVNRTKNKKGWIRNSQLEQNH